MEKKEKTFVALFAIVALLLVVFFILKGVITNKIESRIDDLLGNTSEYEELDVSLLQRKISLKAVNFKKGGNSVQAKRISLSGIGFWDYIMNNKLHIKSFILEDPEFVMGSNDSTASKSPEKKFNQNISIGEIKATNGTFRLHKKGGRDNEVFLHLPKLKISGVAVDSSTLKNTIPFEYQTYQLESDSLRLNLNPEHFVAASHLTMQDGKTSIKDFRIIPYYDKPQFDKKIPHEKDRISLRVEQIEMDSLNIAYRNETLYLQNPGMTVTGGDLEVYRNRELPDDPREKVLYSQMLRNAPVKLNFKKVRVNNSHIKYEEKMKAARPPATVVFTIKTADVENITNIDLDRKDFPRTKAHVEATFQEVVPLIVDWSFNANNTNDRFLFKGKFGAVPGDALNSLLRPSMNMEAKGTIKDTWFTFTGNNEFLTGDVRLNYDQFKFIFMKNGGHEKKGFLTAIANLFVDNDGISGEEVSKEVKVERDVHISFWGYVWNGLRAGVRETFSQI